MLSQQVVGSTYIVVRVLHVTYVNENEKKKSEF